MPVITDTAYPRLASSPSPIELEEAFTPKAAELAFAAQRTRRPAHAWRCWSSSRRSSASATSCRSPMFRLGSSPTSAQRQG